jgi:hypothetical protein
MFGKWDAARATLDADEPLVDDPTKIVREI